MKTILSLIILLLVHALYSQEKVNYSLNHDGKNRKYFVHVPASYDGSKKVALVIDLHGYTSNAEQQYEYTKFRNVADTANILVAYPDATNDPITQQPLWNFGIFGFNVDDVGFLEKMIDAIALHYQVDANRIYMCGISAGATMAYYMACNSNKLTAIGSVAGAMSKQNYQACAPSYPIPVIDFRGTDDSVGPWEGDLNMKGIEDIIAFWVAKNQCTTTPIITNIADTHPNDGATAIQHLYKDGIDGHTVEFFKINGGGHTWPGGYVTIAGMDVPYPNGNTCMDVDATWEMWRFFNQFPTNDTQPASTTDIIQYNYSIFPNPTSNLLNVVFSSNSPATVTLSNLDGKELINSFVTFGQAVIDVSGLTNGIYLLKIGDKTEKILVKI